MKKFGFILFLFPMMLFLFLFPIQALEASRSGLLLWFQTLIPTLLPFMILSNLMIRLDLIQNLTTFFAPLLYKLFRISPYGCYCIFIGFFCGYPMGAKTTADMVNQEYISPIEGQYLLNFCNNISPMFLINFLVHGALKQPELLFVSAFIIYGAPIILAILSNPFYRKKLPKDNSFYQKKASKVQINFELVDTCIMNAFESITKLGGYVILFAILSGIIQALPFLPTPAKLFLTGVTEITNGIQGIASASLSAPLNFVLLFSITCFGGLSGVAQTNSMIQNSTLSILKYIGSKILMVLICLTLTYFLILRSL